MDRTFTLTTGSTVSDVDLWVGPRLRPFLKVTPSHFDLLEAGHTYSVVVHFTIPPEASEGIYTGVIQARRGRRGHPGNFQHRLPATLPATVTIDYGGITIPQTIRVLSSDTTHHLLPIPAGGNTLLFSQTTPELASLTVGDILVMGVTNQTPDGLLGRITDLEEVNGFFQIILGEATIEDAFEDAHISIDQVLGPEDIAQAIATREGVSLLSPPYSQRSIHPSAQEGFYVDLGEVVLYDDDGNLSTEDDQITASGSLALDTQFHFEFEVADWTLQSLNFTNTTTATAELEIKTEIEIELLDRKYQVAQFWMSPITVWVGWVPVVIVPRLSVNVGVEGDVSFGLVTKVTTDASVAVGLTYIQNDWSTFKEFSTGFSFQEPTPTLGANFRGYVGPQLDLLIYGVAGPYVDIKAYLELEADLLSTPWWKLYGGIEAGIGARVQFLSRQIADYHAPQVIGYRQLLAQEGGIPPPGGALVGRVADAVTGDALVGVLLTVRLDGAAVETAATQNDGLYEIPISPHDNYSLDLTKTGFLPASYSNVVVEAGTTTFLEPVLLIDQAYSGTGRVSGHIGGPAGDPYAYPITVELRSGINVREGPIVASSNGDDDLFYWVSNLDAGHFTGHAISPGFYDTFFTVVCIGGRTTGGQGAVMAPIIQPGEMMIVLTWGVYLLNLDSHLTGPLPDGSRFHIFYFWAENAENGSPWPDFVTLDDDSGSFGPEAVALLQQIEGLYRYSVHDFSNRESTDSRVLSNSSAQVRVYGDQGLVALFNAPANQEGTLWTVFQMIDGIIEPVNAMTYATSASEIRRFPDEEWVVEDPVFLKPLPDKAKGSPKW